MVMKVLKFIVSMSVLCFVVGVAGRFDWSEQIVYNMTETTYKAIVSKLGEDSNQYDIATEYMNNKKYYDTLSEWGERV